MDLRDANIVDYHQVVLEGCAGDGPGVLQAVETYLGSLAGPGIGWSEESLSTTGLKGLFGKRRGFLVITSDRFQEHAVYAGARDFGTALAVVWVHAVHPRLSPTLRRVFGFNSVGDERLELGSELDLFDQLDLDAFLTVTRRAVENAIETLIAERKPDKQRPGVETSGFLS